MDPTELSPEELEIAIHKLLKSIRKATEGNKAPSQAQPSKKSKKWKTKLPRL